MTLEEMESLIDKCRSEYYSTGRSNLSDEEYDALERKAEQLGYIRKVGSEPVNYIPKIYHEHKMLSLDKVHSVNEVRNYFKPDEKLIIMPKADGLTCSATYVDGMLVRLETRGNGLVGSNILHHSESIENLPLIINKKGKYVVDGECIILQKDFEEINKTLSEPFSNSRNLASGSLSLLDANESKRRHLRLYVWDVIQDEGNLDELLDETSQLGFSTIYYSKTFSNDADLEEKIEDIKKFTTKLGFPIDGIVIKYSDKSYVKKLGYTEHHFRNALAYKFADEKYVTTLKSITWQVGRTGIITPVANFEPVDMDGVIVEKATLHNVSVIKELGLTEGCTVIVSRSNDVIPKIHSSIPSNNPEIKIPDTCPICGAKTRIYRSNLLCTNPDCSGRLLGRLEHFTSKKGLNVDGLSEQTLELLISKGYLTRFEDLFQLRDKRKELIKLPGLGRVSVDKLLKNIDMCVSNVTLDSFLCSLSIPNVGSTQSKIIARKFKTWDKFIDNVESYDFTKLDGFGETINSSIHSWFENNTWVYSLASRMNFKSQDVAPSQMHVEAILGHTFVITGKISHYSNRDALKDEIERLGGKVNGSVTKNTEYLINNDSSSNSSKSQKAKELGVRIITEDEYIMMKNGDF